MTLCQISCRVLSHVWLFATPWTVAHETPLSMDFSRQEYWIGLPFPSPGDLPNPGIKPASPASAGRFFATSATWEAPKRDVGLPQWLSGEESICQCRRRGFDPRSGKVPRATEQLNPRATTIGSVSNTEKGIKYNIALTLKKNQLFYSESREGWEGKIYNPYIFKRFTRSCKTLDTLKKKCRCQS